MGNALRTMDILTCSQCHFGPAAKQKSFRAVTAKRRLTGLANERVALPLSECLPLDLTLETDLQVQAWVDG